MIFHVVHRFPTHPNKSDDEIGGKQSEYFPEPYTIYMDSMAFGMGQCCLQVGLTRALLSELISSLFVVDDISVLQH